MRPRVRPCRRGRGLADPAAAADPHPVDGHVDGSDSKAAVVVPMAESTRPQFGSSPWMAHLSRLLRDTARPTSSASSSVAAPTTSISMSLDAPSASAMSCRARSAHTAVDRVCQRQLRRASTPDAPLASSNTVSLVDMQPSESMRSKVRPWPCAGPRRPAAVDDRVGGDDDEHGGQRRGEHAGALGHAADGEPVDRDAAVLGTVSVVMMATAASAPPSRRQHRGGRIDPGEQERHRQPLADESGRADRDVAAPVSSPAR